MMAFSALIVLAAASTPSAPVLALREQAKSVSSLVESKLAKNWLAGADQLTDPTPRTIYRGKKWMSEEDFKALPADEQAKAKATTVDAELYYNTKYGTPIAYARVVDLASKFGLSSLDEKRVMDFGYGGIGQLRLFACQGGLATGVDVDPFLTALYSKPEDSGVYVKGTVSMVEGHFPGDAATAAKVGDGYDLIVSKNTLKRGYIHPERPADKRMLIDLGVDDAHFLSAIHDALKPGGLLVIYNLCPAMAPADKQYVPWADGHSPFSKDQYNSAGLKVLAFDVVDDDFARKMAHAVGWDAGPNGMDLRHDLFTWYTVVQRPIDG